MVRVDEMVTLKRPLGSDTRSIRALQNCDHDLSWTTTQQAGPLRPPLSRLFTGPPILAVG